MLRRASRSPIRSLALVAVLALGTSLFAAAPASAATFTVNTTDDTQDDNVGNGICADSNGDCSLRAAIQETNDIGGPDTINVPAGTYVLDISDCCGSDEDSSETGDLDINDSLTILGDGMGSTIIDGDDAFNVLDIHWPDDPDPVVEINDLTVTQGYDACGDDDFGGGIHTRAVSLTLRNVEVTDNEGCDAGGIRAEGHLTMIGGEITSNRTDGEYAAGGLEATSTTLLQDVYVGANSATDDEAAGGIRATSRFEMFGGTVEDNVNTTSDCCGQVVGGIWTSGRAILDGITITDNLATSTDVGVGGLLVSSCCSGPVVLENLEITENEGDQAGGLKTDEEIEASNLTVENNESQGYDSSAGGWEIRDEVLLRDSSISFNGGSGSNHPSAGGVFVAGDDFALFENVTVEGNRTTREGGAGGIYIDDPGYLALSYSSVLDNIGAGDAYAGGIRTYCDCDENPELLVQNSTIDGNTGGDNAAGVYAQGAAIFKWSEITGNSTTEDSSTGGIRGNYSSTIVLTDTTVSGNTGKEQAGGVYSNSEVIIRRSTVSDNTNDGTGGSHTAGGVRIYEGQLNMDQSTVDGNESQRDGSSGGVAIYDSSAQITDSTISNNVANEAGLNLNGVSTGAMWANGSIQLHNSTVSSNTAGGDDGVGGLYQDYDSIARIASSAFVDNVGNQAGNVDTGGGAQIALSRTVLDHPATGDDNCGAGDYLTGGRNLSSDLTCSVPLVGPGDVHNTAPNLGPLQNNGGPTETHKPNAGSPAIDTAATSGCPNTDQRGVDRPQGDACDKGPVEVGQQPDNMIKRRSSGGGFIGDDIYNATGQNQGATMTVRRNRAGFFDIKIENDGDASDQFLVRGSPDWQGFLVNYFRGGTNISNVVKNGTYLTPVLAPGDSHMISMRVFVTNGVPNNKVARRGVKSTSLLHSDAVDVVIGATRAKV